MAGMQELENTLFRFSHVMGITSVEVPLEDADKIEVVEGGDVSWQGLSRKGEMFQMIIPDGGSQELRDTETGAVWTVEDLPPDSKNTKGNGCAHAYQKDIRGNRLREVYVNTRQKFSRPIHGLQRAIIGYSAPEQK